MITQEKIDITDIKTKDIYPDVLTKIEIVGETKLLPVNKASGGGFRLVHDGKKAFIIEGDDKNITETIHAIEEFVTEQLALDRIKELKLDYEAPALPPAETEMAAL